jgi:signal transduction histidine kinase
VDNALKYTQEGSVHVVVEAEEDRVHVLCRDTGIGIDAEEMPEVSNRFYRGGRAVDVGGDGSGLGLSIVTRIVERHGGRLQVHSEREKGTEFRITLPREKA